MVTSTAAPIRSAAPRPRPTGGRFRLPVALAAVALAGVAGAAVTLGGSEGNSATSTSLRIAPSFTLPDVRGGGATVGLGSGAGRPVVVNFFASWCVPCREELPLLEQASRRLAGSVDVVGVDVGDSRTAAVELLERTGVTFPAGFDPDRKVAARYRLQGMPTTVFVDGQGRIAGVARGKLSASELDRHLAVLGGAGRVGTDGAHEKG